MPRLVLDEPIQEIKTPRLVLDEPAEITPPKPRLVLDEPAIPEIRTPREGEIFKEAPYKPKPIGYTIKGEKEGIDPFTQLGTFVERHPLVMPMGIAAPVFTGASLLLQKLPRASQVFKSQLEKLPEEEKIKLPEDLIYGYDTKTGFRPPTEEEKYFKHNPRQETTILLDSAQTVAEYLIAGKVESLASQKILENAISNLGGKLTSAGYGEAQVTIPQENLIKIGKYTPSGEALLFNLKSRTIKIPPLPPVTTGQAAEEVSQAIVPFTAKIPIKPPISPTIPPVAPVMAGISAPQPLVAPIASQAGIVTPPITPPEVKPEYEGLFDQAKRMGLPQFLVRLRSEPELYEKFEKETGYSIRDFWNKAQGIKVVKPEVKPEIPPKITKPYEKMSISELLKIHYTTSENLRTTWNLWGKPCLKRFTELTGQIDKFKELTFDKMNMSIEANEEKVIDILKAGMKVKPVAKPEVPAPKEIKRVEAPPYNFILYSTGEIKISSAGKFIEPSVSLLKEAKETLGIIAPPIKPAELLRKAIGKPVITPPKFEFKIKAGEEWRTQVSAAQGKETYKKITSEKALTEIKKSLEAQKIKYTVSGARDYVVIHPPKTEPEFLDQSPSIGMSVKEVIPVSIRVEREPKDLVGLTGFIQSWLSPVRHIAEQNPIANKIAHLGRDTITGMTNEQTHYAERIDEAYKGLNDKEQELVTDYLEGKLPTETIPDKLKKAYQEADAIRNEMLQIIQEDIGKDTSQWGIKQEEYWPHIFVGSYQITDGTKTIEGGFARTLKEAMDKAVEYLKQKPEADIKIAPKDFGGEYTATMLTRKGFWRFISEVKKSTELDRDEILSMMKGVAAIKPRGKFVGNFMQRSVNLGGYLKNKLALKIYVNRILRKKWLDPFRKEATDKAMSLEQGLRNYFLDYIDDVSGKYDPINNKFIISKVSGRITGAQSKMKLGFRPITALVNRFQPMQTAYAEIGNYLFMGSQFKNTIDGQKVVQDSGIAGQLPKYYMGEFLAQPKTPWYKPMGMFSIAEMANRKDVIAGGYLFAKKIFQLPKEHAIKMGYQYILNYLDEYKDPYKAVLEYAKNLNADTNYIYDVSDIPRLLRKPLARVPLQFKNFPINFTTQTIKWFAEGIKNPTPHNTARAIRFTTMNLFLGGVRTIPYIGRNLWKWLILTPLLAGLHPKAKEIIGRGIFSLIGVDLSQRLGPNEFLPRNLRDLLGPISSDLYVLYKYIRGDITLGQAITQPFGALRDIYRAMRETEHIADPNKRWRKIVETTGWDKFLQAIGSPVVKVEVTRDLQIIFSDLEKEYKTEKANIVDGIIARREQGKPVEDLYKQAREKGIRIMERDMALEKRKKEQPALERALKTAPRDLRKELKGIIEKGGF